MKGLAGLLVAGALASGAVREQAQEAPPADAAAEAFLEQWAESLSNVRSLEVHFVQRKELRILRRPKESRGFVLMRDGHLRMVLHDDKGIPTTEVFVSPEVARIHYPGRKLLEVYRLEDGAALPTPFPVFVTDVAALRASYDISHTQPSPDTTSLLLTPRTQDSKLRELRMRFHGTRIVRVQQLTTRGDRVVLDVVSFQVNPEIDDERLEFVLPPETKVLYPLESKRDTK